MEFLKQRRLLIKVTKVKVEVFQGTMNKTSLPMVTETYIIISMARRELFRMHKSNKWIYWLRIMKLTKEMVTPLINKIITNKDKLPIVVTGLQVAEVGKTTIMAHCKTAIEMELNETVMVEWEEFQ